MQNIPSFSISTFPFDQISMLQSDARCMAKGGCFFAIPGTLRKGSAFIKDAKDKGATHFIIPNEEVKQIDCTKGIFYTSNNIRRDYALAAAAFYKSTIPNLIAITGTNGKSSITEYIRQLLEALQKPCASFGTIGFESQFMEKPNLPKMTSLDACDFHHLLQKVSRADIQYFIFEASSHGLDQSRSDGARVQTAIFTNLTPEHLDYHKNLETYFEAKLRLFTELLDKDGVAILDIDSPYSTKIMQHCTKTLTYGELGEADLQLLEIDYQEAEVKILYLGKPYHFKTQLIGKTQIKNLLAAIGSLLKHFIIEEILFHAPSITSPEGRMEQIETASTKPTIFIDYAHTPNALEQTLSDLSQLPHHRLYLIFGCGGNRDRDKRQAMGRIAARLADIAIITDDNPREEDPASIRKEILRTCPSGVEFASRRQAIQYALTAANSNDLILIAGKGHESIQEIKGHNIPFSDRLEVLKNLAPLQSIDLEKLFQVKSKSFISALEIDSRKIKPNTLFIPLTTDKDQGENYIQEALNKGAAFSLSSQTYFKKHPALQSKLIPVNNSLEALNQIARYTRARTKASIIAITGSVGKTTTTSMLSHCFSTIAKTCVTKGNFNNHLGLPLSLSKLKPEDKFGIFELGMSSPGEIAPLSQLLKPELAIITNIDKVHLEAFKNRDALIEEKASIFKGIKKGTVLLNRDDSSYERLASLAKMHQIFSFGKDKKADFRLLKIDLFSDHSLIEVSLLGEAIHYRLNHPGMAFVKASLITLAAAKLYHLDLHAISEALANFTPPHQRGNLEKIPLQSSGYFYLLDESYNASPLSMKHAIAQLALFHHKNPLGRKICMLGDMAELGADSKAEHLALLSPLEKAGIDQVYACGNAMKHLFDALPKSMQGAWRESAAGLFPLTQMALKNKDYLLIKASNSMGLSQLSFTPNRFHARKDKS